MTPEEKQEFLDALTPAEKKAVRVALEQAAQDWQWGQWANAPRRSDVVQERLANAQYVTDWLWARARRFRD